MKLNGIPLENHKINQENVFFFSFSLKYIFFIKERLKNYFNKIQNSLPNKEEKKQNNPQVDQAAAARIISANTKQKTKENKKIEQEINEWDIIENKNNPISKKKEKKKLLKGALLPSGKHLTWKDELEKMLK